MVQIPDGWVIESFDVFVNGVTERNVIVTPFSLDDLEHDDDHQISASLLDDHHTVGLSVAELDALPRPATAALDRPRVGDDPASRPSGIRRVYGGPGLDARVASALPGGLLFSASMSAGAPAWSTHPGDPRHGQYAGECAQSHAHVHGASDSQRAGGGEAETLMAIQQRMAKMAVAMSEMQEELALTQGLLHTVITGKSRLVHTIYFC